MPTELHRLFQKATTEPDSMTAGEVISLLARCPAVVLLELLHKRRRPDGSEAPEVWLWLVRNELARRLSR